MGTMRWTRWALAAALVLLVAIALGWCGPRRPVPTVGELPGAATSPQESLAVGDIEVIVGVVTSQDVEYGARIEDPGTGQELVEVALVVTVDPVDAREPFELEIPRGYVPYPPADEVVDPLEVGSSPVEFTVRSREDGRYVCGGFICLAPPGT